MAAVSLSACVGGATAAACGQQGSQRSSTRLQELRQPAWCVSQRCIAARASCCPTAVAAVCSLLKVLLQTSCEACHHEASQWQHTHAAGAAGANIRLHLSSHVTRTHLLLLLLLLLMLLLLLEQAGQAFQAPLMSCQRVHFLQQCRLQLSCGCIMRPLQGSCATFAAAVLLLMLVRATAIDQ